jgi:hypothetical protein
MEFDIVSGGRSEEEKRNFNREYGRSDNQQWGPKRRARFADSALLCRKSIQFFAQDFTRLETT